MCYFGHIVIYFCPYIVKYHINKHMKEIFSSTYRIGYLDGYSMGLNPHESSEGNTETAFSAGFKSGRLDYENMNGLICFGIPQRIVTEKVLEDFLIAGMLGFDVDADGYTANQMNIISKWYESGIEKYEPNQYANLSALLSENEIKMNQAM
ncbi:hypothetical protein SAMN05443667_101667 [Flavobacterium gillisiae]|uniref:Uncharacterized protein n=2 Tax=Flavobacterium gillisiae TaxID=150146 RepID=A0A1H3XUQ1_9FLAO|nr:hypothetical protein SAMN05443667_101667 [Flavobacterium gillisiae]